MDKAVRYYNEADTRAKLIDPKIKLAGWGESQIEREHYFVKGRKVTDGRIFLGGEESRRREPHRVDYLLCYYKGQMIAVLEAKDESHPQDTGLEQVKSYAQLLDVPFAYSSNGHAFVEFDYFENRSRELSGFPAPDGLWHRWQTARSGKPELAKLAAEEWAKYGSDPLLHPFCPPSRSGKEMWYFQEVAVRRVVERIVRARDASCSRWLRGPARRSRRSRSSGSSRNPVGSASRFSSSPTATFCATRRTIPSRRLWRGSPTRAPVYG